MTDQSLAIQLNPILRIANQAQPLAHIVHQAVTSATEQTPADAAYGVSLRARAYPQIVDPQADDVAHATPDADPTLIDLTLHLDDSGPAPPPPLGVGYAGLSPRQRYQFLSWASGDPLAPAPTAFQQLYCAHLEVRLLEAGAEAQRAQEELPRLWQSPAWQGSAALARTQLLAFWIIQDGAGLAAWIGHNLLPGELAGIALGLQALLGQPLEAREIITLATLWPIKTNPANINPANTSATQPDAPDPDVLRLHLSSLESNLGERILHHALRQLPEEAIAPQPWRANHRGLRLEIPQPDLRSPLLPLLRDLFALPVSSPLAPAGAPRDERALTVATNSAGADDDALPDRGWQLILEFGNSRSEYFDIVMRAAQKLPGYAQLMDENRQLVHRITFKRSELRRFWRIWDYVQSWSSTHVYLNGQELEKWKVWPYSQYLQ